MDRRRGMGNRLAGKHPARRRQAQGWPAQGPVRSPGAEYKLGAGCAVAERRAAPPGADHLAQLALVAEPEWLSAAGLAGRHADARSLSCHSRRAGLGLEWPGPRWRKTRRHRERLAA